MRKHDRHRLSPSGNLPPGAVDQTGAMSSGPLDGCVVGITADRRWAEQADLLRRRGAQVLHGPSIATAFLSDDERLKAVTVELIERPPRYLAATTGIGMRAWFEAAGGWGLAGALSGALSQTLVVARGPKSAAAVQAVGLEVWRSATSEQMDEVVGLLLAEPLAGARVAVQLYGMPAPGPVAALSESGAEVIEVAVYQWRTPDDPGPAIALAEAAIDGRLCAVTFTAAPAVTNLFALAATRNLDQQLLDAFNQDRVIAACVGPVSRGEPPKSASFPP